MLTVLLGALVFTSVTLVLVAMLLAARSALVPSGPVQVTINGGSEHDFQTQAGSSLLSALTGSGVFLPSACGGQGTCGVCRVKVDSGAGALLRTETSHITRGEAREGWRLACQVRVKQDVRVEIPREIFGVRRWHCRVRSNHNVATFIKELVLDVPAGDRIDFRAGGYIQIECPPYELAFQDFEIEERFRDDWTRYDLWRLRSRNRETVQRAYSMANYPDEDRLIMLNVRIATPPADQPKAPPGVVSSYIFGLRPGDPVEVIGPFGEFFARDTRNEMVFIGGGAGMAPMRSHIFDQLERIGTQRKISFWYGARSLREAFYGEAFDRLAATHDHFEWHLALSDPQPEDEWTGPSGFIHQVVLDRYLSHHPAPEDIEYYLCGPPMMLDACRRMLDDLGVDPPQVMYDDFGG